MKYDTLTIIKLVAATLLPVVLSVALYFAEKKTKFGKANYRVRQAVIGVLFGGTNYLKLYFGQTGMEIEEIKFVCTQAF